MAIEDAPDLVMMLLKPERDQYSETFPFAYRHKFYPLKDPLNFCVPTCINPEEEFVVATGMPGMCTNC